MTDFATSLRHNACRTSESLNSFLRASSATQLELTDLQAQLQTQLNIASKLKGNRTDSEVDALILTLKESSLKIIEDLETKLTTSNSSNSKLTGTISALQASISTHESDLLLINQQITSLQADLDEQSANRISADSKQSALSSALSSLHLECESLKSEYSSLKQENSNQQTSINDKSTTINKLNETISELKDHKYDSNSESVSLKKELKACKKEIETLETTIKLKTDVNKSITIDFNEANKQSELMQAQAEKDKKSIINERRGREIAENRLLEVQTSLTLQLNNQERNYSDKITDLENLIAQLQEEIELLKNVEKAPDGSKFKLYVDLKSQNKQLSKQLQQTQEKNAKMGANAGRPRRNLVGEEQEPQTSKSMNNARRLSTPGYDSSIQKRFPEEVSRKLSENK